MPEGLRQPAEDVVTGVRRTQVLLVDDHEVVRIGLRQLFDAQGDMRICSDAATLAEARAAIDMMKPDVVVLDLTLGEESGLGLLRWLEGTDHACRVLVLSMFDESLYSDDALALGIPAPDLRPLLQMHAAEREERAPVAASQAALTRYR